MASRLLHINLFSLTWNSSNSLFDRTLTPLNSLCSPFHFKSLQGCNICWAQLRPTDTASERSLICPVEWWEERENEDISQIYDAWCEEYVKTCLSNTEKLISFEVFKHNYEYVRQYNEHSNVCSLAGIDDISYLTEDENLEEMAAKEGVISSSSIEFMNEQLARNDKLIVACFTSRCSQPCELMFPIIDDLAEKMPEVTFLNVDLFCSRLEALAKKWEVETTPTIMFIKNGEVVDKFVGFVRGKLLQRTIAKHVPLVDTKKKVRQKDEPLTCPLGWWEGHENEDIPQIFEDYCKEYRTTYISDKEKLRRFKVFKYNHEYERQHDKYFNTCTPAEFDGLSDITEDELVSIYREHPLRYNITILDGCQKGQVMFCDTIEAWNEQLAKGQGNSKLVVVGFFAEWCPPCKLMRPVLRYLAKKMPEVTFLEVDVVWEDLKSVAEKLGVEAIPTFMLMKNGEVVDKVVGAVRDELQLKIAAHSSVDASA